MPYQYKSKKDRLAEVLQVLKLLRNLGIPLQNEGIIKITNILKQWVNDGKYQNGRIKLRGYEREIIYELYTRQGTEIAVNLKFVKGL